MKITGVGRAALMALGIAILAGCGKQDAQEPDMQREIGDIQGAGRNTV